MTPQELLAANGIALESTAAGRYYTTCPQCSHKRKPAHKKLKCLGITINAEGVKWGCNHCDFKGGEFYENTKMHNSSYSPFVANYI
jgi:hypothetical protein